MNINSGLRQVIVFVGVNFIIHIFGVNESAPALISLI